jgi:L-rhamnose mutarotase
MTTVNAAAVIALAASPAAARWEASMATFFSTLEGARADQGVRHIREVFNLEDQLAAL